jgi:hypothetical protein
MGAQDLLRREFFWRQVRLRCNTIAPETAEHFD